MQRIILCPSSQSIEFISRFEIAQGNLRSFTGMPSGALTCTYALSVDSFLRKLSIHVIISLRMKTAPLSPSCPPVLGGSVNMIADTQVPTVYWKNGGVNNATLGAAVAIAIDDDHIL